MADEQPKVWDNSLVKNNVAFINRIEGAIGHIDRMIELLAIIIKRENDLFEFSNLYTELNDKKKEWESVKNRALSKYRFTRGHVSQLFEEHEAIFVKFVSVLRENMEHYIKTNREWFENIRSGFDLKE